MGVHRGTYAFLEGRLGALKAEFLSADDWKKLLDCSSWDEQFRLLESTAYAPWLIGNPEDTVANLRHAVYRVARKVERSVPSEAARFIHVWRRRDLLRNLRTILRGKALGRSEEEIRGGLLDLDPTYQFPTETLINCTNLDEAFDLLGETGLSRWVRAARQVYQRDPTLFGLDSALDRLYYPEVRRESLRLGPSDRSAVNELLSLEIDQVNLLWLLRYRLNYGLSPAETYYLLVPASGHITAEQLKALVREDSLRSILNSIQVEAFRKLLVAVESIWEVEVAMWRHRARVAGRMLSRAAFTIGSGLALLLLKVVETRDLIALLGGTSLGASRFEIEQQLVGAPLG